MLPRMTLNTSLYEVLIAGLLCSIVCLVNMIAGCIDAMSKSLVEWAGYYKPDDNRQHTIVGTEDEQLTQSLLVKVPTRFCILHLCRLYQPVNGGYPMGPNSHLYEKAYEAHCRDLQCEAEKRRLLAQLPRQRSMGRSAAYKSGVLLLKLGTRLKQFGQSQSA